MHAIWEAVYIVAVLTAILGLFIYEGWGSPDAIREREWRKFTEED